MMISKDQIDSLAYWVTNVNRDTTLASRVLVAKTPEARRVGLLNHESLPAGEGLLIVPANRIHTIGMHFPIDVAFMSKDFRVINMYSFLDKDRFASCNAAHSALELPAGMLSRSGTQPDDYLSFTEMCG